MGLAPCSPPPGKEHKFLFPPRKKKKKKAKFLRPSRLTGPATPCGGALTRLGLVCSQVARNGTPGSRFLFLLPAPAHARNREIDFFVLLIVFGGSFPAVSPTRDHPGIRHPTIIRR